MDVEEKKEIGEDLENAIYELQKAIEVEKTYRNSLRTEEPTTRGLYEYIHLMRKMKKTLTCLMKTRFDNALHIDYSSESE
jgi:hypothetical protein